MAYLMVALLFLTSSLSVLASTKCVPSSESVLQKTLPTIKTVFAAGELIKTCQSQIQIAKTKIDQLIASAPVQPDFQKTHVKLDQILADYYDQFLPISLLALESPEPATQADAGLCKESANLFESEIFQNKSLYQLLKKQIPLTEVDQRLYNKLMSRFEKNGHQLESAAKQAELSATLLKIENLLSQYDTSYSLNDAPKSLQILSAAIEERQKAAVLLGYKTWADYRISNKMPKVKSNAELFLNTLQQKATGSPAVTPVTFNEAKVSEYFPADYVIPAVLDLYSEMLGLQIFEIKNAPVWHESVTVYEVQDASDCRLIGFIYNDIFEREKKLPNGAAIPVIVGRKLEDGRFTYPASVFTKNFKKSALGAHSLLTHDNVRVVFHEFGHIMHQILSKTPYWQLSGTNVDEDFNEVPSQFFENWVWNADVLSRVSSHYLRPAEKLPTYYAQNLIAKRKYDQKSYYLSQLAYAQFDLEMHSSLIHLDPIKTYNEIYKKLFSKEPKPETNYTSINFYLMVKDAGLYGYMWGQGFDNDLFSIFEKQNLLSQPNYLLTKKFRETILEKGDAKSPNDLMKDFLGREPNFDAFFKKFD